MSKYVIDIDDAYADDLADELVGRMVSQGDVQISSPSWNLPVTVVGKVVAEDCPGDQQIVAVEPLGA